MPVDKDKLSEYFKHAREIDWSKADFTKAIETFERLSDLSKERRKLHGCQCASCQSDC